MNFLRFCALLSWLTATCAFAEVRLPAVISDHMVLQAGKPASLWGWAEKGEGITIEFSGQKKTANADEKGKWKLRLDTLEANSESRDLRINDKVIRDVIVGEVWLGSGQSNMEMRLKDEEHGSVDNADAEVAAAKYPSIRVFVHDESFSIYKLTVPSDEPAEDRSGKWQVCSPETAAHFSAIGYLFARDLHSELNQPIGVITSSVGGTPIEAWTSLPAQQGVTELKSLLDDWGKRLTNFVPAEEEKAFLEKKAAWLKVRAAAVKAKQPVPKAPLPFKNLLVMKPGGLYASMIAPLAPYTIRGVIWYQGERNAAGPFSPLYGRQLELLITDWRAHWNDPQMHFAYVQLPTAKGIQKLPSEPKAWGVAVRDGQRRTLMRVPHTSMAITMDLGGDKNGHPTNKADYAKRLSTVVLHDVYEKPMAESTGPLFKSASVEQGKMVLTFDHAEGLKASFGTEGLEGFAIAGPDGKFQWANAKIEDGKVVVWHEKITEPKTVHYAFAANPKGNLVNGTGYPASPFSTEE